MSCSLRRRDRAHLRELLQGRLNGKASGFRDAHLDAMIKQGLNNIPEKQPYAVRAAAYGKRRSSDIFHVADLIIAAAQRADALQQGSKYRGVSRHWSLSGRPWRARIHWLGRGPSPTSALFESI
ncbi:hypothetical protein WJX82_008373 [Trebouxia sp. C0006]